MYGQDILCRISKVPFEIPHKISYPYIERCTFYTQFQFQELLDLRAHMCFLNAPGPFTWTGLVHHYLFILRSGEPWLVSFLWDGLYECVFQQLISEQNNGHKSDKVLVQMPTTKTINQVCHFLF